MKRPPILILALAAWAALAAPAGATWFEVPRVVQLGTEPVSPVVGDFNGDGIDDVAVSESGLDVLSLHLGDGSGAFAEGVRLTTANRPSYLTAADADRDGHLDLIVVQELDQSIALFYGVGDGTFEARSDFDVGVQPRWAGVFDVSGDAFPELVVAVKNQNEVKVFPSTGLRSFGAAVSYPVGHQPIHAAFGDLDGDGDVDLAVAHQGDDSVGVLLADGNGGFDPVVAYAVGNEPRSVQLFDADRDGVVDLIAVNRLDDDLSVWKGLGDGTFATRTDHDAGRRPVSVASADVDGDCVMDLVVSASGSDAVQTLLGDGSGGFGAPIPSPAGLGPEEMAFGDFNRDLRIDLAIANTADASMTILLNAFPQACGGFVVRRADHPAEVRTADPWPTVPRGPVDDAPGTLTDGNLYFYVVEHEGGASIELSLSAAHDTDTLRIGFADGRDASAPVDGTTSDAGAEAAVAAVGEAISIRVTPRDSAGDVLGRGLALEVDLSAFAGASLVGAVKDLGNGDYRLSVTSTIAESASVTLTVEGIVLLDAPTLTFR